VGGRFASHAVQSTSSGTIRANRMAKPDSSAGHAVVTSGVREAHACAVCALPRMGK